MSGVVLHYARRNKLASARRISAAALAGVAAWRSLGIGVAHPWRRGVASSLIVTAQAYGVI